MPFSSVVAPEGAHVVMLAQYLPLHFLSTMQKLSRKVGRLTLVISEPMDATRDWRPDFTGLNVSVQKSLRIPVTHRHPLGFKDAGAVMIPYTTINDLRKLRPDVVIAVEVGARTMQAALLQKIGASFKLIVQVRESENTASSRGALRRGVRRFLLPRVDHVFVNGASGRRHALACGVDAARVSVVPSGTDTDVFGSHPRIAPSRDELRLLYVGQLVPRKGVVPFARVLAAVAATTKRPIRWSIAGRGPQESELRALPWSENVKLEFLGSKPYHELSQYYEQADVFTMPSLSDEWGLVVNEAMACGLPVLGCTGAQSVDELVVNGASGWTYEPGDDVALRAHLNTLLSTPSAEILRMGAEARRVAMKVSDEFAASAIVSGIRRTLATPRS